MSDSNDAGLKRPVITYIIVAVALVAALILCVRWVKTRANFYAESQVQSGQSQNASSGNQEPQPVVSEDPQTQQQQAASNTPSVASPAESSQTLSGSVAAVPSAGPEHFAATVVAISAIAFSVQSYARARRRLHNLAK